MGQEEAKETAAPSPSGMPLGVAHMQKNCVWQFVVPKLYVPYTPHRLYSW